MRPGQTLSENEVAARLGVSRTPVREAIIRLESEGLLTVRPQIGTVVAPIDLDAVMQQNLGHGLTEGTHVIRMFPSRGHHESVKDAVLKAGIEHLDFVPTTRWFG